MVELREIEEAAKQAPIKRAARKRIALRVIFAFAIVVVGIGLFFFLKALLFPSVPSPRKGIFFWESGREQSLFGRDTTLRVLLNQTFHRLNLKKDCSFSKEGVDRIKAGNKLIELIPENPEDIKINQWIKPDERDHLPTDEDGYRILENVQATIFTLEDNLAKGLQAVILIKKEDEEQWSCWAIEQEASGELDKSWIGEINKLLAQEQIEAPQTPEIFLITKVIDGDTVELETGQKVRYLGVDAPNLKGCFGTKVRAKNRNLVVGKEAKLYKDMTDADKAGRLLRYVWVEDLFVNDFLVRQGYAVANPQSPDVRYEEQFRQAEAEAKEEKRGLWQACKPKPVIPPVKTTGSVIVNINCSQFNAPGDDNFNKREEYVCFTNKDTVTVNMEGWMVEDGWYGWVYTFPKFTLLPGRSVRVRTGCGSDSFTNLYWCKMGYEVWHNEGDTVYLRDSSRTIIDTYTYTEKEAEEPET